MSTEEKKLVENLMKAVSVLPEQERKYLSGYAEGVIAARLAAQPPAPAVPVQPSA